MAWKQKALGTIGLSISIIPTGGGYWIGQQLAEFGIDSPALRTVITLAGAMLTALFAKTIWRRVWTPANPRRRVFP